MSKKEPTPVTIDGKVYYILFEDGEDRDKAIADMIPALEASERRYHAPPLEKYAEDVQVAIEPDAYDPSAVSVLFLTDLFDTCRGNYAGIMEYLDSRYRQAADRDGYLDVAYLYGFNGMKRLAEFRRTQGESEGMCARTGYVQLALHADQLDLLAEKVGHWVRDVRSKARIIRPKTALKEGAAGKEQPGEVVTIEGQLSKVKGAEEKFLLMVRSKGLINEKREWIAKGDAGKGQLIAAWDTVVKPPVNVPAIKGKTDLCKALMNYFEGLELTRIRFQGRHTYIQACEDFAEYVDD